MANLEEIDRRRARLAAGRRCRLGRFSLAIVRAKVPSTLRAQRDLLATQAKLLKADVKRGEQIRASLPQVGKDCDAFYESRSWIGHRILGYRYGLGELPPKRT